MSTVRAAPDLIFVTLVHQALRRDGDRLVRTVGALTAADRAGRLPQVHEYYRKYREQLVAHHTHEDKIFFPALAAHVGDERMHRDELVTQHEELDDVLQAIDDDLTALARPDSDFAAHRDAAVADLSKMVEHLTTHLSLEESTALPLVVSDMPAAEYKTLESKARKATPRSQAGFMVPWMLEHASPDQRKALYRVVPPFRVIYPLSRRRYLRLDEALLPST
jgi:hemerythrin-like domain-containing protein